MMLRRIIITIIFLYILVQPVSAFEGTLAKGAVYFNDQMATVDNATLKIGEPFTVRVEIFTKQIVDVAIKLSISGFRASEKQPYEVIEGPRKINEVLITYEVPVNTNLTYIWKLRPTEVWAGGTAPLNIDFTIHPSKGGDSETIGFTIVNAYISKEYYQGVTPSPTPSPSPAKAAPGFEFVLLALSLVIALAIARGNR